MKKQLTIEELPPEYRALAEVAGIDAFLRLVDTYGGCRPLYIPKLSEVKRNRRNQKIVEGFTGKNYTELAKEHDLSEMSIRRIIKSQQQ
jgi:Mor family transcriptional regulator